MLSFGVRLLMRSLAPVNNVALRANRVYYAVLSRENLKVKIVVQTE